jgi:hypothetical protein
MFLGTRPAGDAAAIPGHSNRMVVNEAATATGVALHAAPFSCRGVQALRLRPTCLASRLLMRDW